MWLYVQVYKTVEGTVTNERLLVILQTMRKFVENIPFAARRRDFSALSFSRSVYTLNGIKAVLVLLYTLCYLFYRIAMSE